MENVQYSPIRNYRYEHFFQEVQYNGKELNNDERKVFVRVVDELISQFSEGLPKVKSLLDSNKDVHDEYHEAYSVLVSVMQFVMMTMIDSMVIGKYFILANKDYDRRFMRGKMKVILNEGFKKLYGFEEKSHKKSEWYRLAGIMKYFPKNMISQYQELSSLLEEQSISSSWWKDERGVETHLDADKLYVSRCEDVVESKVMMDSMKLYYALSAVDAFLTNMHRCFYNFCIDKYNRGELKEE